MNDRDRFRAATDESALAAALQPHIEAVWRVPVRIEAIEVPRVFSSGRDLTLQYRVFVRRPDAGVAVLLLGGRLFGGPVEWPEWARRDDPRVFRHDEAGFAIPVFPFDPVRPVSPNGPTPRARGRLADGERRVRLRCSRSAATRSETMPVPVSTRADGPAIVVRVCGKHRRTAGATVRRRSHAELARPHVLATDEKTEAS